MRQTMGKKMVLLVLALLLLVPGAAASAADSAQEPSGGVISYAEGQQFPLERPLSEQVQAVASDVYSPELACTLMALSAAAYDAQRVQDSLDSLGFLPEDIWIRNYTEESLVPGYSLAKQPLSDDATLVLVTVRGSEGRNWLTDLTIGPQAALFSGRHSGFDYCRQEVQRTLREFLDGLPKTGVTYVLTGHSLGGAVSNLLAVSLLDAGVPRENVYAYQFACPNVASGGAQDWNPDGAYDSLFNIGSCQDPVTYMPTSARNLGIKFLPTTAEWGKYGRSFWYSEKWGDPNHVRLILMSPDPLAYVEYLSKLTPLTEFHTAEELPKVLNYQLQALLRLLTGLDGGLAKQRPRT